MKLGKVISWTVCLTLGAASAMAQPAAPPAPAMEAAPVAAPAAAEPAPAAAEPAPDATAGKDAKVAATESWYEKEAAQPWAQHETFWMPPLANTAAGGSDSMFYAVLALSIFFFVAITAATVYFVIKYRHRPGHKAEPSPSHSDTLEITWTVIPTIIVVFLFVFGWRGYMKMVAVPQNTENSLEVQVEAYKWGWNFLHHNGATDSVLHVPVDTPVRLVMKSKDVIHSFWVPAFRIKQDVLPNRYTYLWFYADKPGVYRLYCAEYCGRDHSQMKRVVVVHKPGDYERYLSDSVKPPDTAEGLRALGEKLYVKKGCNACHSIDGSRIVGPTFKGEWGASASLADGSTVKVDENYVTESLMTPNAKARVGYPVGQMPSFAGMLKEYEIRALIEYMKSLQ